MKYPTQQMIEQLDQLHVLSVRSPWWWWIIHGPKDRENRPRASKFKGPVAIQVSRTFDMNECERDHKAALEMFVKGRYDAFECEVPKPWDFKKHAAAGHIVGIVNLTGYTRERDSVWFTGPVGWMLSNPVELKTPILCRGHQYLVQAPRDIRTAVKEQLGVSK